ALRRPATDRAGLAEAAAHAHLRPERGDFFWKRITGLVAQALRPFAEHFAHGCVKALDVAGRDPLRMRDRRKPRAMQDLVRICIADAAEQARVGERALERVILTHKALAEFFEGAGIDVDPAHVEFGK